MPTNIDARSSEDISEKQGEESEQIMLAIKLNEESSDYECARCGDERISAHGPELFLADTWEMVCDECGHRYAPTLAVLIDLGIAADDYSAVRNVLLPKEDE